MVPRNMFYIKIINFKRVFLNSTNRAYVVLIVLRNMHVIPYVSLPLNLDKPAFDSAQTFVLNDMIFSAHLLALPDINPKISPMKYPINTRTDSIDYSTSSSI